MGPTYTPMLNISKKDRIGRSIEVKLHCIERAHADGLVGFWNIQDGHKFKYIFVPDKSRSLTKDFQHLKVGYPSFAQTCYYPPPLNFCAGPARRFLVCIFDLHIRP